MTSQEIFSKLMGYRNDSVRGDKMLDEYFDAIMYSVAKVLDLSNEQAAALAGDETTISEAPSKPEVVLEPEAYEITSGYVGSMGVSYEKATAETLTDAIGKAAERNGKTIEEIKLALLDGQKVAWCNSPNHYYDHGTGYIRTKRNASQVQLVKCSCGHSVQRSQVMSASLGTSCQDCYDRMSA